MIFANPPQLKHSISIQMSISQHPDLKITSVTTRKQLKAFISLPWKLYDDDPHWVPPLYFEQIQRLTKSNPFFEHAEWQAWMIYRGDRIVGRISAQIDQLRIEYHSDRTGYFGMLEAENDPEVFALLFSAAEDWLKSKSITRVLGPFNLSINEESGLLIDGFQSPPSVMMGHARPYYGQQIENLQYTTAQDLLAYIIHPNFSAPDIMQRLLVRAQRTVKIRSLRRKQFKQELDILRDIFNDAWSENWGFVPFTVAEFQDMGQMLSLLVEDDYVQIAEIDGKAVAMTVALPNINEITRTLNGKLLPFGWLKLLWKLKINGYPKSARIPLMGVRKEYQHTRLGPALAFMVIDAARKGLHQRGIQEVELSWILESNQGVRHLIEACGGEVYKRYRVFQKDL